MRIDGPLPTLRRTLAAATADLATAGPAFGAAGEAPAVVPPPRVAATQIATTSVQMLVALATVDAGVDRRRRAAAEAGRGLVLLERLRDAMARGDAAPEAIAAMRAWVDDFAVPDDPVLGPIAREIDLRVRVELARHDMRA